MAHPEVDPTPKGATGRLVGPEISAYRDVVRELANATQLFRKATGADEPSEETTAFEEYERSREGVKLPPGFFCLEMAFRVWQQFPHNWDALGYDPRPKHARENPMVAGMRGPQQPGQPKSSLIKGCPIHGPDCPENEEGGTKSGLDEAMRSAVAQHLGLDPSQIVPIFSQTISSRGDGGAAAQSKDRQAGANVGEAIHGLLRSLVETINSRSEDRAEGAAAELEAGRVGPGMVATFLAEAYDHMPWFAAVIRGENDSVMLVHRDESTPPEHVAAAVANGAFGVPIKVVPLASVPSPLREEIGDSLPKESKPEEPVAAAPVVA